MYNSYIHTKNLTKDKSKSKDSDRSLKSQKLSQKLKENLIKNHHFRIVQHVIEVISTPDPSSKEKPVSTPKLHLDSFMRLKPRDSKSRIQEAISNNSILDPQPLTQRFKLRPREKEKEIQNSMKFKPKDRIQRLIDLWESEKEIISSWEVNKRSLTPLKTTTKKDYQKSIAALALNTSPELFKQEESQLLLKNISEESLEDDFLLNDKKKVGLLAQAALRKTQLRLEKSENAIRKLI